MDRKRSMAVALAVQLAFSPIVANAGQRPSTTPPIPRMPGSHTSTMPQRTSTAPLGSTTILGTAWNADTKPLVDARIRLRNVATGRIEATTTTNQQGEFMFQGMEGGTYVTELVDNGGRVLAVGETFTVETGGTVVTFIRLPPRRGGLFGGLWGNAAAAAVAAAAGLGITAVQPCSCAQQVSGEF
ncbi:MAG: carboxypeptidase regulatory-like domain-containing protein [Acidobacteria bacterium]|nr:carboxypeptidase regulatory-like domain-containing protein [Acidobacteriota bacterium]